MADEPQPQGKKSKAERLAAEIEAAERALAKAEADLIPKIAQARAEVAALDKARHAAEVARKRSSEAYDKTRNETVARLGLVEHRATLTAEVEAWVQARGWANANRDQIVAAYVAQIVASDKSVVAMYDALCRAQKAERKAYGDWNVATSPLGTLKKLERALDEKREVLAKLKDDLKKLPAKREAERESRAAERAEEAKDRDTRAALAAIAEFESKVISRPCRHVPAKSDTMQTVCVTCGKTIAPLTPDGDTWVEET